MVEVDSSLESLVDLEEIERQRRDNSSDSEAELEENEDRSAPITQPSPPFETEVPNQSEKQDESKDKPPIPPKQFSPKKEDQSENYSAKLNLNTLGTFKISDISKVKLINFNKKTHSITAWLELILNVLRRMQVTGDDNIINLLMLHLPSDEITIINKLFDIL